MAPGVDTSQISSNNQMRARSTNLQGMKKINIKPIGQQGVNKINFAKPIKINSLAVKRPVSIKPMGAQPEPMTEAQFEKKKQDVQNLFKIILIEIKMLVMMACKIIKVLNKATLSASVFVSPIFSPNALAHNLHIVLINYLASVYRSLYHL